MVRQHDAARTDANRRRSASEITDHDGSRGARDAGHVVMFGDPVALVTKRFRVLREIKTLAQRLAWCFTKDDRNEIEYRDGNHACSYSLATKGTKLIIHPHASYLTSEVAHGRKRVTTEPQMVFPF